MKRFLVITPVFLSIPFVASAQQTSGTYATYLSGRQVFSERFKISPPDDGRIKVDAELTTAGSTTPQRITMVLTSAYRPLSYSLTAGGSVISADLNGSTATLRSPGQPDRVVPTHADALYANALWSPFIFILRRYDGSKGGQQSFVVFSPMDGRNIPITLERIGVSNSAAEQPSAAESYRIILGGKVEVDVWSDPGRVPLVLAIPSQGLKVVKDGWDSLAATVLKDASAPGGYTAFTAEEVTFKNGDIRFSGTLTIPKSGKGPFPAAVLITGSGLQDRDDNPAGNSMFKFIAERLSANGIAVLRHDDRGYGKSTNPTGPTTYLDLISDTRSAIEYVRSRKEIDPERVALIGHSEGAETAAILAEEDPRIAAIVTMAGVSRPLDFVLIEQAFYAEALKRLVDPASTDQLPEVVRALIKISDDAKAGKQNQGPADLYGWFSQHSAHDPLKTIGKVKCPILILQGERDEDALAYNGVALAMAAAQGGNKQVRLRIFPDLTHVFTASPLGKSASVEQLSRISEAVIDTLERWAVSTLKVRKDDESKDSPVR